MHGTCLSFFWLRSCICNIELLSGIFPFRHLFTLNIIWYFLLELDHFSLIIELGLNDFLLLLIHMIHRLNYIFHEIRNPSAGIWFLVRPSICSKKWVSFPSLELTYCDIMDKWKPFRKIKPMTHHMWRWYKHSVDRRNKGNQKRAKWSRKL